jgi:hypothetical protein
LYSDGRITSHHIISLEQQIPCTPVKQDWNRLHLENTLCSFALQGWNTYTFLKSEGHTKDIKAWQTVPTKQRLTATSAFFMQVRTLDTHTQTKKLCIAISETSAVHLQWLITLPAKADWRLSFLFFLQYLSSTSYPSHHHSPPPPPHLYSSNLHSSYILPPSAFLPHSFPI